MRKLIIGSLILASTAFADGACKYSDTNRLKEHLEKHIKYPATGKAIKAACAKEWPDEFTPTERACCNKTLKDATEYKSASDVEKALGV